jgi:uncharacterized BrkB/YihY/UPF0761 family membrane protein
MVDEGWAKHREWLVSAYEGATQSFDKAIMTLAGGALGVSIAFIHDVAPKPIHKWLLGVAWILFAVSLLLILISFLASQRAILDMMRQIDEDVEKVARGKATDRLNWTAAGSFVVGVVFLVIFALYNLGR